MFRQSTVLSLVFAATCLAGPADTQATGTRAAAEHLQRANAAFASDRIVTPIGDNALEWTLAARDLDPSSPRVREGLNDLYPLIVLAIDRQLSRGEHAEAKRVIALLESALPQSLAARRARERLARVTSTADLPGVTESSR